MLKMDRKRCPLCRRPFTQDDIHDIHPKLWKVYLAYINEYAYKIFRHLAPSKQDIKHEFVKVQPKFERIIDIRKEISKSLEIIISHLNYKTVFNWIFTVVQGISTVACCTPLSFYGFIANALVSGINVTVSLSVGKAITSAAKKIEILTIENEELEKNVEIQTFLIKLKALLRNFKSQQGKN